MLVGCKLAGRIKARVPRMLARLVNRKLSCYKLVNRSNSLLGTIVVNSTVFGCLDRRNYNCSSFLLNNKIL